MNHPSGRLVFVYALVDPTNEEVRYVGWTINPESRLKDHLKVAQNGRERNHRTNWILSLLKQGQQPIIRVLESEVSDFAGRERYWISHFRSLGCKLTNGTDGGEGMLGWSPSEQQRKKISEVMRELWKLKPNPFLGKKHTAESRAKMSAWQIGRTLPIATRLKLSEIRRHQVFSAETRSKISKHRKAYLAAHPEQAMRLSILAKKGPSPETRLRMSLSARNKKLLHPPDRSKLIKCHCMKRGCEICYSRMYTRYRRGKLPLSETMELLI